MYIQLHVLEIRICYSLMVSSIEYNFFGGEIRNQNIFSSTKGALRKKNKENGGTFLPPGGHFVACSSSMNFYFNTFLSYG